MRQTISNLLLDISTLNLAFSELSFVTGAAGSASKDAHCGPPWTLFLLFGNQIATTERTKHLPVVETELPPKKGNLATEALDEALNDSFTVSLGSTRIRLLRDLPFV